jgi:CubicO group peptidase (beta-lactamase class C family)
VASGRSSLRRIIAWIAGRACILGTAQATTAHDEIAAYLDPYISSGIFSGSILVVRDGKTLFRGSCGLADASTKTSNRTETIFHVASERTAESR